MKNATHNQVEQLVKIKDKIKLLTDTEAKTNLFVDAEEILKNIDFMSSFYSAFVGDLRRYKTQKGMSIEVLLLQF
ncbi:hypothetical protein FNJ88_10615 [Chryseobacterium sp. SNU WT5]|uniref:hypothetical protein n=1 Tax=Chryseobacterium sp. SNU WT5 TaxID=2594269 RepID=UPI00117DB07F|nr:hypothetical protein [Chryseobacterium sp. SNU WT5]QDP85976.1 hypothetical protein FNJ88_10615 [Chryseobacterium sp. SNU WT5]